MSFSPGRWRPARSGPARIPADRFVLRGPVLQPPANVLERDEAATALDELATGLQAPGPAAPAPGAAGPAERGRPGPVGCAVSVLRDATPELAIAAVAAAATAAAGYAMARGAGAVTVAVAAAVAALIVIRSLLPAGEPDDAGPGRLGAPQPGWAGQYSIVDYRLLAAAVHRVRRHRAAERVRGRAAAHAGAPALRAAGRTARHQPVRGPGGRPPCCLMRQPARRRASGTGSTHVAAAEPRRPGGTQQHGIPRTDAAAASSTDWSSCDRP